MSRWSEEEWNKAWRTMPRETDKTPYISLAECVVGHVYKIWSRNLRYGVYDGKEGFIGIRTKFGARYLFTEYHWDQGPPFGTVKPIEDLGMLPEGIPVQDSDNKALFEYLDSAHNDDIER